MIAEALPTRLPRQKYVLTTSEAGDTFISVMMKAATRDPELSLIKTIAVASRPLEEDMKLSRLQAIDRLQKLQERFRDLWVGPSPWLVLNGYALPNAPVDTMLKKMDEYGDPVGMVGIAFLPRSKRIGVLKMLFRGKADARARKLVERAADEAVRCLPGLIRPLDPLKGSGGTQ